MERVAQALMQDRLSTDGSFILCDGMADGFPIRYASRGFVELFGYTAVECVGKKCGALVAGPSITASDIANVSQVEGLSSETAHAAIATHTRRIAEECKKIMTCPGEHISFSLALNRTKEGKLFVCEILMLALQHPVVGWTYTIGLQRDVSADVSVGELLRVDSEAALNKLIARCEAPARERIANLKLKAEDTREFFHSKSMDMWEDMMRMVLATKGDLKVQDLSEGSVTLGGSTSGGNSELASSYDTLSSWDDDLPVCLHVKSTASGMTTEQLNDLFKPYGDVLKAEAAAPGGRCASGVVVLASPEAAAHAAAGLSGCKCTGGGELSVTVGALAGAHTCETAFFLATSKALASLCSGTAWSAIDKMAH